MFAQNKLRVVAIRDVARDEEITVAFGSYSALAMAPQSDSAPAASADSKASSAAASKSHSQVIQRRIELPSLGLSNTQLLLLYGFAEPINGAVCCYDALLLSLVCVQSSSESRWTSVNRSWMKTTSN